MIRLIKWHPAQSSLWLLLLTFSIVSNANSNNEQYTAGESAEARRKDLRSKIPIHRLSGYNRPQLDHTSECMTQAVDLPVISENEGKRRRIIALNLDPILSPHDIFAVDKSEVDRAPRVSERGQSATKESYVGNTLEVAISKSDISFTKGHDGAEIGKSKIAASSLQRFAEREGHMSNDVEDKADKIGTNRTTNSFNGTEAKSLEEDKGGPGEGSDMGHIALAISSDSDVGTAEENGVLDDASPMDFEQNFRVDEETPENQDGGDIDGRKENAGSTNASENGVASEEQKHEDIKDASHVPQSDMDSELRTDSTRASGEQSLDGEVPPKPSLSQSIGEVMTPQRTFSPDSDEENDLEEELELPSSTENTGNVVKEPESQRNVKELGAGNSDESAKSATSSPQGSEKESDSNTTEAVDLFVATASPTYSNTSLEHESEISTSEHVGIGDTELEEKFEGRSVGKALDNVMRETVGEVDGARVLPFESEIPSESAVTLEEGATAYKSINHIDATPRKKAEIVEGSAHERLSSLDPKTIETATTRDAVDWGQGVGITTGGERSEWSSSVTSKSVLDSAFSANVDSEESPYTDKDSEVKTRYPLLLDESDSPGTTDFDGASETADTAPLVDDGNDSRDSLSSTLREGSGGSLIPEESIEETVKSEKSYIEGRKKPSVNDEFVLGLDDLHKFVEEVDPPDELDVGAAGSSMQEVLMGQGVQILKKRVSIGVQYVRKAVARLNRKATNGHSGGGHRKRKSNVGLAGDVETGGGPFNFAVVAVEKNKERLARASRAIRKACLRYAEQCRSIIRNMLGAGEDPEEDDDDVSDIISKLDMMKSKTESRRHDGSSASEVTSTSQHWHVGATTRSESSGDANRQLTPEELQKLISRSQRYSRETGFSASENDA